MSYVRTGDVGDIVQKGMAAAEKLKPVLAAAENVLADPALPEVAKLVLELREIEKRRIGKAPGKTPAKPPSTEPGIGLKRVVKPLRYFVELRRDPWKGYVLAGAILAVPFLLGYRLGKRRK